MSSAIATATLNAVGYTFAAPYLLIGDAAVLGFYIRFITTGIVLVLICMIGTSAELREVDSME